MTKNEKEIYDLLLKEAGEEQLVEETNANNSTTQICEEQNYNFKAGYEMPRDFQCAGVENAGKYMRVGTDGYVRPMPGQGEGGGYEPDLLTIGLTSNSELAVRDYISYTTATTLLGAKQDTLTAGTGISIVNNVISATGGGSGVPLDNFIQGDNVVLTKDYDLNTLTISATGGGGTPLNYVESIQPHDYSITYTYYEKEQWNQNEIYFASINGQSVIGKNDISVQPPLTADSEIEVKKIWFDNYYIDKLSLSTLLNNVDRLVEKELPTFVNDKYLKVVNGALSWEDAGGSGGNKYYIHTVSFNTLTSPEIHCQVGVITKNSATYQNFDAFWNDRKKIVTFFGTPNMISNALYFNGAMADNFAIKARGVTFENGEFFTDVIDIEYSDIDAQSFGDYGVEEL